MQLVVEHLAHAYNDLEVLKDVDFCFEQGKIYGLLGRNGAGKTTFFRCLSQELIPHAGRFYLQDASNQPLTLRRDDIAFMRAEVSLPEYLTGRELLEFFYIAQPEAKGICPSAEAALALVGIKEQDQQRLLLEYSSGMKAKVSLLLNYLLQQPLLLLDEPFTAIDVIAVEDIKSLLRQHKDEQITIMSTHNLDLALDLCDEIVLLANGVMQAVKRHDLDSAAYRSAIIAELKQA